MKAIGREAEAKWQLQKSLFISLKMYEKCMRDAVLVELVEKIEEIK